MNAGAEARKPVLAGRVSAHRALAIGLGVLLVGAGLALAPSVLIQALRPEPGPLAHSLALGARLFTYNLVLLGAYVVVLGCVLARRPRPVVTNQRLDGLRPSLALGAIVAAAAALRFHALDTGLWHDEILMYVNYAGKSFGEILTTYDSQNQHFLYTLLARLALVLFGEGTWVLRLPAALFGIASIGALYLFAREVVTRSEALLAAALLAFSYHHVWFSQNARGYTGLLFWTLLSSWCLLRALREGRRRWWVLYAGAAALGLYTHMTMAFVVLGQAAVYGMDLWVHRRERWTGRWDGGLLGFPLAALLTLQLYAVVIPQVLEGVIGEASPVAAWRHPFWTLVELLAGARIGFSGSLVAFAALVVFVAGLLSFVRAAPAVVMLLTVPVVLCAVVVIGSGHHLWPRFFFFALGFAGLVVVRGTVVLGRGLGRVLGWSPATTAAVATGAAALLVVSAATAVPRAYAPKQDYLGALRFIEANRSVGDSVATVGVATFAYRQFYRVDWESLESVESLERLRAGARRTWVVYTLPLHVEEVYPQLMATIQREFRVIRTFPGTLSGGVIVVCRADRLARSGRAPGVGTAMPARRPGEA